MRLNQKGYPAYFAITEGRWTEIKLPASFASRIDDASLHSGIAQSYWQVKERYMMAQTFKAAFEKAAPKIKDNTAELMKEGYARVIFNGKQVMLCVMASIPQEHNPFSVFVFEEEWLISMHTTNRDGYTMGWKTIIAPTGQRTVVSGDSSDFREQAFYYMKLNYFIKNCETELKVVAPNTKLKTKKEKIFNESNRDIIILDAVWFTTIVRDTPFGVDGHFRWQPFGEGRQKVKLKWIDSYQKEGYTMRAKIEK